MLLNLHSSDTLSEMGVPLSRNARNHVVLLVLDCADSRRRLGHVLKTKGYHVVSTDNGQDASRHAREMKPDLVVVELDAPLLYELVAARQIIKHAQLDPVPVVIVTHEDTIDPAPMIEVGVTRNEYVTRLSDYNELHELLDFLLPALPAVKENRPGHDRPLTTVQAIPLRLARVSAPKLRPHPNAAPGKSPAQTALRPLSYLL